MRLPVLLAVGGLIAVGGIAWVGMRASPAPEAEARLGAQAPTQTREAADADGLVKPVAGETRAQAEEATAEVAEEQTAALPEELRLGRGRRLEVLALDPEREPIAGALVRLDKPMGVQELTDAKGLAWLQPVPAAPSTLQVLARGFEIESLPCPPTGEQIEVVLRRSNKLTVRVLDTAGNPLVGALLGIAANDDLFTHHAVTLDAFLSSEVGARSRYGFIAAAGNKRCIYVTDESGVVELQCLNSSVQLELSVVDNLLNPTHSEVLAPIGPMEQREHVIQLTQVMLALDVRVTDLAAAPIQGALVSLQANDVAMSVETSSAGLARFESLYPGVVTVVARHADYAGSELRDQRVGPERGELQVQLDAGRDVRIHIVDALEQPMWTSQVLVHDLDGNRLAHEARTEGWTALLDGLPRVPLEIRLELAGKEYRAALDATSQSLEVRVPVHGRLEVALVLAAGAERDRLALRLRGQEDAELEQFVSLPSQGDRAAFDPVLPGRYALTLGRLGPTPPSGAYGFTELGAPVQVEVRSGATASVAIGH
jgi:hypothetical protein